MTTEPDIRDGVPDQAARVAGALRIPDAGQELLERRRDYQRRLLVGSHHANGCILGAVTRRLGLGLTDGLDWEDLVPPG